MSRRFGMPAGMMLLGALLWVGSAVASEVSIFDSGAEKIKQKYGIEVTGGLGLYSMQDVNDYRDFRIGTGSSTGIEDAANGINIGVGLLYRSQKNFRWNFGYASLGSDRSFASFTSQGATVDFEQSISGSEVYVLGNYLIPFGDHFHVGLGVGPTLVNAAMSHVYSSGNQGFADASGRAIGLRAQLNAELLISQSLGINVQGGYRMGKVGAVKYTSRAVDTEGNAIIETVYWSNSNNRTLEVDFSGIYFQAGLRYYFQPATKWIKI